MTVTHSHLTMKFETLTISQSMQVPPNSCLRKMDLGAYVTCHGLSVIPGEPINLMEVSHCEKWIQLYCRPRQSINPFAFSYNLKHHAENWRSGLSTDSKYVSNGSFIWAALNLGYKFIWDGTGPNCFFDMRLRWNRKRVEHRWEYNQPECFLPFDYVEGGA